MFVALGLREPDNVPSAEARLAACSESSAPDRCFDRVYSAAAASGEVPTTLAALERLSRGALDDCHLQAHRLAHAVYRVVGDVERTFLLGGPECRLGYLHGAVEASGAVAVPGAGAIHGIAVPPCRRFRMHSQRSACSHGLGHALMRRTGDDLRASIDGCRQAAQRGLDRVPCERGVMMENSLRYSGRAGFPAAPARACERAVRRVRRLCFQHVGVVAALSLGHDLVRATALCRRLLGQVERDSCLGGATTEIGEARRASGGRG